MTTVTARKHHHHHHHHQLHTRWQLKNVYQGTTFFEGFEFFHAPDPTHGFVNYVNRSTAVSKGLVQTNIRDNTVLMQVDHHTVISHEDNNKGRSSVRISSRATFQDNGLFLFDIEHMPTGCGTWPALWLLGGPDIWPNGGEIDIIEGVNLQAQNLMTLHTSTGCKQPPHVLQRGHTITDNCDVNAINQAPNQGCSVQDKSKRSFGTRFNQNRGGVFAVKWTPENGIKIWFFDRRHLPRDIQRSLSHHHFYEHEPNPNLWGIPTAQFPFHHRYCNAQHFKNLKIIINTTFCGDWAGNDTLYKKDNCPSNCIDFVRNNPKAFHEAYWRIRAIKVYTRPPHQ